MNHTHIAHAALSGALAIFLVLLGACDDAASGGASTGTGNILGPGGSTNTSGGTGGDTTGGALEGEPGSVTLDAVQLYQMVNIQLKGVDAQGNVIDGPNRFPVVEGKDAMVRLFPNFTATWNGAPLTARVTIGSDTPLEIEVAGALTPAQEDLNSTINIDVPGSSLVAGATLRVELVQGGTVLDAWPAEGAFALNTTDTGPAFNLTLIPFQYNADGSGRTPDTSPERIEAIRQRMLAMYPFADVRIRALDPVPWNNTISPFGEGWQEIGYRVLNLRAGAAENEFYYGFFMPTENQAQFCSRGCLLGVTLLNEPYMADLNLAIGVGFNDDSSVDTMMHELMHAHGIAHAPCGPGLDPSSIDRSYPTDDATINEWGYDPNAHELVSPSTRDVMSYCYPQWMSSYNATKIIDRAQLYKGSSKPTVARDYEVVLVDGDGAFTLTGEVRALRAPPTVTTTTLTDPVTETALSGHFYRFTHLPGGMLFVPAAP